MDIKEINNKYNSDTIGNIVSKDYRKAKVFKSFGIDFCCGGGKTLLEVTEKKSIDLDLVIQELVNIDRLNDQIEDTDFNNWKLDKLINHIISKHHKYVRETISQLTPLLHKVCKVHGNWRPELLKIKDLFTEISDELTLHMMKEENVLFPFIIKLENQKTEDSCFGSVQNPISMMEIEHENAGNVMKNISELSNGYTLPEGACNTYTVVYKTLKAFENDLHQHIHLENNILFPKAIILENDKL